MQYRNARTKTIELVIQWLISPIVLTTVALAILLNYINLNYVIVIWIYILWLGNFAFFMWDTKNIPHTIDLEDDHFIVITRSGEESIRWDDIDDLLWKKVVAKRSVVGLYLKGGDQKWLRSIRPDIAKAMEKRWKKV